MEEDNDEQELDATATARGAGRTFERGVAGGVRRDGGDTDTGAGGRQRSPGEPDTCCSGSQPDASGGEPDCAGGGHVARLHGESCLLGLVQRQPRRGRAGNGQAVQRVPEGRGRRLPVPGELRGNGAEADPSARGGDHAGHRAPLRCVVVQVLSQRRAAPAQRPLRGQQDRHQGLRRSIDRGRDAQGSRLLGAVRALDAALLLQQAGLAGGRTA
jgi:hypothetical protein